MGFDSRVGFASLLVGLLGLGITLLWPNRKWVGWIFILAGLGTLVFWVIAEVKHPSSSPSSKISIISIGFDTMPTFQNPSSEVFVNMVNSGAVPTKHLRWVIRTDIASSTPRSAADEVAVENSLFSQIPADISKDLLSAPNQLPVGVVRSIREVHPKWEETSITKLNIGVARMYVFGSFFYAEDAGIHQVDFCAYLGADRVTKMCRTHNT